MVRNQIGKIFAAQHQYSEAMNYFKQSLAELEAANMERATAVVLNDISDLYLAQGMYEQALPSAEQSVALSRKTRRQADLWWALTLLGYCQVGLNRFAEARRSLSEAVSIGETLRSQAAGGVEERQRYFEGGVFIGTARKGARRNRFLASLAASSLKGPSNSGRINLEESAQDARLKRSNSCHRYESQQAETARKA